MRTWDRSCPRPRSAGCVLYPARRHRPCCRRRLPASVPAHPPPHPSLAWGPRTHPMQVLEYEQQYLQALPLSDMYEKSYMHRDTGGWVGGC